MPNPPIGHFRGWTGRSHQPAAGGSAGITAQLRNGSGLKDRFGRLMILGAIVFALNILCVDGLSFELLQIKHLRSKGRVQEGPYDPVIEEILSEGKKAIPKLVELIDSERVIEYQALDYWPEVREGDVALAILTDLFLDPTRGKSALPNLSWDNILLRSNRDVPAWELLNSYVEAHGRSGLADQWRKAWEQHKENITWDPKGQFFRIEGRELSPLR